MKLFTAIILGSAAVLAQSAGAQSVSPTQDAPSAPAAAVKPAPSTAGSIPGLPAPPKGKSTIMGGQIQRVDQVRDEITLKVYGEHPEKILYDERTQYFRDGKRLPLLQLKPADHASVQTLLDGVKVYALSIHVLSKTPQGEYQGTVLDFNPSNNQLTMSSKLFKDPLKLVVPPGTPMERVGQAGFASRPATGADLSRGSLISVEFGSDNSGHGVASHISVLATQGAAFTFVGNVASLDVHAGTMSIVGAQDDKMYQLTFNPGSLPQTQSLRPGDNVMVTAAFRGDHYVASAITINK